jgi:hypothetical protein
MVIFATAKATMISRPTPVVMFFHGSFLCRRFMRRPYVGSRIAPREYDQTQ